MLKNGGFSTLIAHNGSSYSAIPFRGERRKAERRCHVRYPVNASLEAVELQSAARFTGRVSDLSMGGCYADTITVLPVGATLKVRLTHDEKFFETKTRVIVSLPGMGIGMMFTDTGVEQIAALQEWIRELSGEVPGREPDLPEMKARLHKDRRSHNFTPQILSELVVELMKTGAISGVSGRAILEKIEHP